MLPTIRSSYKLAAWILVGTALMLAATGAMGIAIHEHSSAQTARLDSQRLRLDAQQAEIASQRARLASQRFALHQICVAVHNENDLITKTFQRTRRNLTKLTYYRQHPTELRLQQAEIRRELRVFRPRTCK